MHPISQVLRAIEVQVSKIRLIRNHTLLKRIALSADDAAVVTKAFRNMSLVLQAFEVSTSFLNVDRNETNCLKMDPALSTEATVNKILKVP